MPFISQDIKQELTGKFINTIERLESIGDLQSQASKKCQLLNT